MPLKLSSFLTLDLFIRVKKISSSPLTNTQSLKIQRLGSIQKRPPPTPPPPINMSEPLAEIYNRMIFITVVIVSTLSMPDRALLAWQETVYQGLIYTETHKQIDDKGQSAF